jgi:uncharacterized membrane protein YesL
MDPGHRWETRFRDDFLHSEIIFIFYSAIAFLIKQDEFILTALKNAKLMVAGLIKECHTRSARSQ